LIGLFLQAYWAFTAALAWPLLRCKRQASPRREMQKPNAGLPHQCVVETGFITRGWTSRGLRLHVSSCRSLWAFAGLGRKAKKTPSTRLFAQLRGSCGNRAERV
jgi:hypothetical protein